MIYLVQPPVPAGVITGGYRYNAEVAARLRTSRLGRALEVPPQAFGDRLIEIARETPACVFLVDSLFLTGTEPDVNWREALPATASVRLMLHYLPSGEPGLEPDRRERVRAAETAWLGAVDGAVATGAGLARAVADLTAGRLVPTVAPPGVDACFRAATHASGHGNGSRDTAVVLVSVGTLTSAKGQRDLVRAVSAAAAGGPPARLVIIGDHGAEPAYAEAVRRAAAEAPPGLDVELPGCLAPAEVAVHLQRGDLYVSTSRFESYGMAVAEAAAVGIPVLCYRTGEIAASVDDGVNGCVVEPNDEAGFEAALRALMRDPARRVALRGGRRRQAFPTWDDTFRSVLRGCGVAPSVTSAPRDPGGFDFAYATCVLPTEFGDFDVNVYRDAEDQESLLISMGDLGEGEAPLIRIHSECFTGEVLGSLKCDCRDQLLDALRAIAAEGRGAVVYLRQEGRGIGLGNKIRAYAEQAKGADTVEANEILGFPVDLRDFTIAARILQASGVTRIRLNTNNPAKIAAMRAEGLAIEQVVPSTTRPNPHNRPYLETKFRDLGHLGLAGTLRPSGERPADERDAGAIGRGPL